MHLVRLEPTKLILIGTRTTYQATGDAGICLEISTIDRSGNRWYVRGVEVSEFLTPLMLSCSSSCCTPTDLTQPYESDACSLFQTDCAASPEEAATRQRQERRRFDEAVGRVSSWSGPALKAGDVRCLWSVGLRLV